MPYLLDEFLGLELPKALEPGDTQNIGTGRADVDIARMPGGGFYDNQGDEDSPRALDTISKSGMVYAIAGSTVRQQVEALRAKLGAKGRLDLLWHDGAVRWIWARFTSIRTPRGFNHALSSLPVDLGFTPIGGFWYADEETVEIETWTVPTTEADFTVTNAGNANVTELVITYVAPVAGLPDITIENYETAQLITPVTTGVGVGWSIVIDVGERTVKIHELNKDIDSIERSGATLTVEVTAHGYTVGNEVIVSGTNYDGVYLVAVVPDANTVELAADPIVRQPHGPQLATGTIKRTVPAYYPMFSDKAHWFTLVPGANTIHVTTADDFDDGSITFEFYATYA